MGLTLKKGLSLSANRRVTAFKGLLDSYPGATAAYSLRRLKSSATKAVRVREDSGNTETDIGFSGGTLDETALLNHCGSNNGFVTKWYDQSGNGNDASNPNASSQPPIVESGSVIMENGKPAIEGSDARATWLGANFQMTTPGTVFSVYRSDDSTEYLFGGRQSTNRWYQRDVGLASSNNTNPNFSTGSQKLTTVRFGSNGIGYENGSQTFTGDTGTSEFDALTLINAYTRNDQNTMPQIQEIIFYNSDQIPNREKIESNINNYYNIY